MLTGKDETDGKEDKGNHLSVRLIAKFPKETEPSENDSEMEDR